MPCSPLNCLKVYAYCIQHSNITKLIQEVEILSEFRNEFGNNKIDLTIMIYILHDKAILHVLHSINYLIIMPKYEQKQIMGQMLQNYLYLHRSCQQLIISFFVIVLCQIVMSTELYCIFYQICILPCYSCIEILYGTDICTRIASFQVLS